MPSRRKTKGGSDDEYKPRIRRRRNPISAANTHISPPSSPKPPRSLHSAAEQIDSVAASSGTSEVPFPFTSTSTSTTSPALDLSMGGFSLPSLSANHKAAGTSNTMDSTHPTDFLRGASSLGSSFGSPNAAGTPGLRRGMAEPELETVQITKEGAADDSSSEEELLSPKIPGLISPFSSSTGLSSTLNLFPHPLARARFDRFETPEDPQPTREHTTEVIDADLFRQFINDSELDSDTGDATEPNINPIPTATGNIMAANDAPASGNEVPVAPPLPENIWCALEENYTRFPPRDLAEANYMMGVQHGIGLAIACYKNGLMEEFGKEGTIFGRDLVLEEGRDRAQVKKDIEERDHFDRAMAYESCILFDTWNKRAKAKAAEHSIEELAALYGGPAQNENYFNARDSAPAGGSTSTAATGNTNTEPCSLPQGLNSAFGINSPLATGTAANYGAEPIDLPPMPEGPAARVNAEYNIKYHNLGHRKWDAATLAAIANAPAPAKNTLGPFDVPVGVLDFTLKEWESSFSGFGMDREVVREKATDLYEAQNAVRAQGGPVPALIQKEQQEGVEGEAGTGTGAGFGGHYQGSMPMLNRQTAASSSSSTGTGASDFGAGAFTYDGVLAGSSSTGTGAGAGDFGAGAFTYDGKLAGSSSTGTGAGDFDAGAFTYDGVLAGSSSTGTGAGAGAGAFTYNDKPAFNPVDFMWGGSHVTPDDTVKPADRMFDDSPQVAGAAEKSHGDFGGDGADGDDPDDEDFHPMLSETKSGKAVIKKVRVRGSGSGATKKKKKH